MSNKIEEQSDNLTNGKTAYQKWRDEQGVPVFTDFYIGDVKTAHLAPWKWKGGNGIILNLKGTDEMNDAYICEIPPAGALNPMRHLYEEIVYIVKGRGATKIWQDGQKPGSFEWEAGSLFSIPINVNYQHYNGSGSEPARYVAVTMAPLCINLYHNLDFIFNCPYSFLDRYNGEGGFFSGEGRALKGRIWDTNFVSDVNTLPLLSWNERGKGSTNRMIELANSSMGAHVSEFEVGKYKKAHRHGPGAHVFIVAGEGYTLMWPEGSEIQKFDWKPGSLIVPPNLWFHQHFNVGSTPAKYLAIKVNSHKHRVFKQYGIDQDVKSGGSQIELANEDPRIREIFKNELAKKGTKSRMDEVFKVS